MKPTLTNGAFVSAEQDQDARFIRLKREEAGEEENAKKHHHDGRDEPAPVWVSEMFYSAGDRVDEQGDAA